MKEEMVLQLNLCSVRRHHDSSVFYNCETIAHTQEEQKVLELQEKIRQEEIERDLERDKQKQQERDQGTIARLLRSVRVMIALLSCLFVVPPLTKARKWCVALS
jgi:hypothetical protein